MADKEWAKRRMGEKEPRIWWGEKLGAPTLWLPLNLSRAGFEPRRGRTTSPGLERTENDQILGDATCTHGSNPARSSQARWCPFVRAEIFALPDPGSLFTNAPIRRRAASRRGLWLVAQY